jgi:sulfur-carrier protein
VIRVFVPTQLRSYTGGASEVEASGKTVSAALGDLDARYRGIKFRVIDEQDRIRPHMRIFVNGERALTIDVATGDGDEIHIFGALSGG